MREVHTSLTTLTKRYYQPACTSLLVLLCAILPWNAGEVFELKVYDLYTTHGPRYAPDTSIVVIENDNQTTKTLSWPLRRDYLAVALDYIASSGASAIAIDVLLDRPSPRDSLDDQALSEIIGSASNVVLAVDFAKTSASTLSNDSSIWNEWASEKYLNQYSYFSDAHDLSTWSGAEVMAPERSFLAKQTRLGHIKVKPDLDGTFRRIPLLISYGPRLFASLALETALVTKGFHSDQVSISYHSDYLSFTDGIHRLDLSVSDHSEALIRFVNTDSSYSRISMLDLLTEINRARNGERPVIDSSFFRNKIVLIAQTCTASGDFGATPVSNNDPNAYILANLIQNILDGSLRHWVSRFTLVLIMTSVVFVLAFLGALISFRIMVTLFASVFAGILALSILLFVYAHTFLPPVRMEVLIVLQMVNYMFWRSRTRESETKVLVNEKQDTGREIAQAHAIQQRLLPQTVPQLMSYEIDAFCRPCKAVGGDYYDFVTFSKRSIGMIVADVAGKGMPAALIMSALKSSFVDRSAKMRDPQELIESLSASMNKLLDPGQFLTAFYVVIDNHTNEARYVNAGHNPPILVRASGEVLELCEGGPMIGPGLPNNFVRGSISMFQGDVLAIYTDGVTESMSKDGKMYSTGRLRQLLIRHRHHPLKRISQALLDDLTEYSGALALDDDTTFLLIARRADM